MTLPPALPLPTRPRAVLFDAGFTLIEPAEPVPAVYWRHAAGHLAAAERDAFMERLADCWRRRGETFTSGRPGLESSDALEAASWRRFTAAVVAPFPPLAAVHAQWLETLVGHFDRPESWRPYPDVADTLQELRAGGCRLAVVSNWHSRLAAILSGLGLGDAFAHVGTSAAVGFRKPHAAPFRAALAAVDVSPRQAVHVGDSLEEDIAGALRAGIAAVWCGPEAVAAGHATVATVSSVAELPALLAGQRS